MFEIAFFGTRYLTSVAVAQDEVFEFFPGFQTPVACLGHTFAIASNLLPLR